MLQALLAAFWLPEQASKNGPESDALFYFILAVNIIFSSLIMALLILFVVKYRHRPGKPHDPTGGHSTALELTWTIIPTLLVLVIFWFGFRGYLHANTMPQGEFDKVDVNGSMWNWKFSYPSTGLLGNGELHLVVNRPTEFTLESADVIHDLDIPAFRMKKDVVPGRYNHMWVEPDRVGDYQIFCAMYCGKNHSTMLAKCVVQSQEDFDKWMQHELVWEPRMSFVGRGQELYKTKGCATCHSVDGSRVTGPSWKDVYGSQVALAGGGSVLADDAYVEESILQPAAKVVDGYQNVMPSFQGQLTPNDIRALTWYLRSISANYKGDKTEGMEMGGGMKYLKTAPGASPATGPAAMPASAPAVSLPAVPPPPSPADIPPTRAPTRPGAPLQPK